MTSPNEVEFSFQLWPHGWSTARLWIDRTVTEFTLTHVFNDPFESLLQSSNRLASGESWATIEWSDEPGSYVWQFLTMATEQHLLSVELAEYSQELPLHKPSDLINRTSFVVARDFWLHLVYSESRKIADSFSYRDYRLARDDTFPRRLFEEFQANLKKQRNKTVT
ncbi:hypothetical protein [Bremerella sp.]|uniref:hypothetical protein n=1 Tax=Bremerella sp. TaxID=2795602 RepID=UPI00391D4BFC